MPIRIYALAKDLKIDSKDLVDVCTKAGVTGKGSALASLTDDEVEKVKQFVLQGGRRSEGVATAARADAYQSAHTRRLRRSRRHRRQTASHREPAWPTGRRETRSPAEGSDQAAVAERAHRPRRGDPASARENAPTQVG